MERIPYEILLAEDHYLVVEGITRVLESMPDVRIGAVAYTGEEAVRYINQKDYDVYLLDVELKDMTAMQLIEIIRARNPEARIVISTMHEEIWIINQLAHQKVNAIILKNSDPVHLQNAIRAVLDGQSYTCPRFESMRNKLARKHRQPKDVPTKREIEILQAISTGLNTHQIAEKLNITDNTVETFRKRLISKLNARNSAELVRIAITRGWIDLDATE